MRDHVIIRPARVADAGPIVELIRSSFASDFVEAFIYGCHGIESYVAQQIALADLGVDTRFVVAERSSKVVACSELRILPDRLFLGYIAVQASLRKQRCGSRLLAAAIDLLRRREHKHFSLDVLETNAPARAWYETLGMQLEGQTVWHRLPLPTSTIRSSALVTGLVQARVSHRELGFGQFSVTSNGRAYTVGILGDHYFRITSRDALADTSLLECLAGIDPNRRLLAIVPSSNDTDASTAFARTLRMTATLDQVRARLSEVT